MPLKNSTSNSPQTFDKIQKVLTTHGADKIMFDYAKDRSGRLEAISFSLEIDGQLRGFKLPAKVENVVAILYGGKDRWGNKKTPTQAQRDQAYRTAWANIRDWIDAQMALIDTEQAKLEEVFLPYMLASDGRTLYEHMESKHFALPSGN